MTGARFRLTSDYATVAEAAARPGASWEVTIPRCRVPRTPPISFGRPHPELEALTVSDYPDLGVLSQEDGYLVGIHGWVATGDRRLITELSWYGGRPDELNLPDIAYRERRLEGVCLSLASDWSAKNYGHFLLDGLGRWEIIRRAGFRPDAFDHVYCGLPNANALRLLERLGFERDQVVEPRPRVALTADRVVAASFPGKRREYPPWLPPFLRVALGQPRDEPPNRRLYVPRTATRVVSNESELWPRLEQRGFEWYEPHDHANPPADFAAAAIVVGAHGAGLADIAFCQPGARVLELVPSDHVYPYWFSLASAAGLGYAYLVGPSEHQRAPGSWGPSPHDFRVDEAEFETALDSLVATAEGRRNGAHVD